MSHERERQTYYGALNRLTHAVPLKAGTAGDGTHTVASSQWWQRLSLGKKRLLLWAGARSQRSAERQTFLARENAGCAAEDWKGTGLLFAPNAPEQNPTEELWLKGKTHLRKNFAVNKTFARVKHCFTAFLKSLSFDSVKLSWYWPAPQLT